MDTVYENLVRRIAGETLGDARTSTLRERVAEQGAQREDLIVLRRSISFSQLQHPVGL